MSALCITCTLRTHDKNLNVHVGGMGIGIVFRFLMLLRASEEIFEIYSLVPVKLTKRLRSFLIFYLKKSKESRRDGHDFKFRNAFKNEIKIPRELSKSFTRAFEKLYKSLQKASVVHQTKARESCLDTS